MLHHVTMKTDTIIRMRLTTFRRLKHEFPADRNETAEKYFFRLGHFLHVNNRREYK